MIAVLGGLADVERDLLRTRTAEGRSRAQKQGQHMGRPPKLTAAQPYRPLSDRATGRPAFPSASFSGLDGRASGYGCWR